MAAAPVRIGAVLVGQPAPFGRPGQTSAIVKAPVSGPATVGTGGVEGDRQADLRVHGGPDKAVNHYPFDHYATWRAELGGRDDLLSAPGAFGENLSTTGLTEADVCIGDTWRAGTALLQVSQTRQPCWKLNQRFQLQDMAARVQQTGRTGWYWRVLEPGTVQAGDALTLAERAWPDWPLARLLRVFYVDVLDRDALRELATLPCVPASWRGRAEQRLARGEVEDWGPRLGGGATRL
ncbi:MOSC domain-containing protein [Arenibaculum sp.]|jgi:MOSC domain-containing protein YiiM|uniref:MOSC domain-containing protein n=1 Tax=Arenibaculum sp. TaxID=2865862 RepID=UPI002E0FEB63|nr:MOSC domain-containing protein [Arenibaculum sp.]